MRFFRPGAIRQKHFRVCRGCPTILWRFLPLSVFRVTIPTFLSVFTTEKNSFWPQPPSATPSGVAFWNACGSQARICGVARSSWLPPDFSLATPPETAKNVSLPTAPPASTTLPRCKSPQNILETASKARVSVVQFVTYVRLVCLRDFRSTRPVYWNSKECVVSHRCHRGDEKCVSWTHLALCPRGFNKKLSSNHCSTLQCLICASQMTTCSHNPSCLRIDTTICSICRHVIQ